MRSLKIYTLLLIGSLCLTACQELIEPANDNHNTIDRVYRDPAFAEGLLMTAYNRIPTNNLTYSDVATNNAVSNQELNAYQRIATGEWSAINNPESQWSNSNSAILYLNNFINIIDTVEWKWSNSQVNSMFARRFKGEAYALRGLFRYHLLVTSAGVGTNGEMLGIPIFDEPLETDANFNIPRATFAESVAKIYEDFDKALESLTMDDYKNITDPSQLPTGFEGIDVADYNLIFGNNSIQRISGRHVKALKARVALLAASPAFSPGDASLWQRAADYAATSLNDIGGIAGLDPVGHRFFDQTRVNSINLASGIDQREIVWRRPIVNSNSRERANFPPSLFGQGQVNPSQNLVDAFPMSNGYPIGHASSLYDPTKPYAQRDPRLSLYIVHSGSTMKGQVINTGVGGGVNAKDSLETSTRTGYYLRKLLREDVNLNPVSTSTQRHYEVHMRYTELFLIYAEAANEAWGPDGTGAHAFSARDVIGAIRRRAGIAQPDNYLASIGSTAEMRELIRNERRLELCFEGFHFWDLRRWKENLTETVKGVNINKGSTTFTVVDVEPRVFNNEFMHYGPLPQTEVIKYSELIQNQGW
jgi:starch-binding outer membrane protein, SusD/RagB family